MNKRFSETLCPLPDLESEVMSLVGQIPRGAVTTYGDLSRALGDQRTVSARWIGEFLKSHHHVEPKAQCFSKRVFVDCVCHRVVRSNGEVGLYVTGDAADKVNLLRDEGVSIDNLGRLDLSRRFTSFHSEQPLQRLKEYQRELARKSLQVSTGKDFVIVAGVDCAYRADGQGVGAYVELDAETLSVRKEISIVKPVSFPYVSGYLSFRELPILLSLLDKVATEHQLPDLILVDGNGILHPRRAGIATCLGPLVDLPTIGVGKSLLCGKVNLDDMYAGDIRSVMDGDHHIGNAVKTKNKSRPVYVSPGHLVTMDEATGLVKQMMTKHRIPEPIFFADRLTKKLRLLE